MLILLSPDQFAEKFLARLTDRHGRDVELSVLLGTPKPLGSEYELRLRQPLNEIRLADTNFVSVLRVLKRFVRKPEKCEVFVFRNFVLSNCELYSSEKVEKLTFTSFFRYSLTLSFSKIFNKQYTDVENFEQDAILSFRENIVNYKLAKVRPPPLYLTISKGSNPLPKLYKVYLTLSDFSTTYIVVSDKPLRFKKLSAKTSELIDKLFLRDPLKLEMIHKYIKAMRLILNKCQSIACDSSHNSAPEAFEYSTIRVTSNEFKLLQQLLKLKQV